MAITRRDFLSRKVIKLIFLGRLNSIKSYSQCPNSLRSINRFRAIRVSEIDPGAVNAEFSEVRWKDKKRADDFYKDFNALTADDIADAMIYCATRPLHVDVTEMIIMPTSQASCNHLHKTGEKVKGIFD